METKNIKNTASRNFSFDEMPMMIYQLSEQISKLTEIIQVNKPTEDGNDLISRKEAMGLLGITDPTLWNWAKQGKIKTYKIGNKVFLKRSEIDEVINRNVTKK